MRPLILIWIAMLSFAMTGFAQHTAHPVETDIHRQEREADLIGKRRRDLEHMNDKIAITYEKDVLGQYIFTCHNNTFCNYVVELSFPDLENLRSDMPLPYKIDVPPGTRRLLALSVITKGVSHHFRHHTRVFKGYYSHASVDTAYTYLLPVPPGRETHIHELHSLAKEFGNESQAPPSQNWYGLDFRVHSGDTIYAARRGRVTETRTNAALTDSGYTYAKEENYVEIAHSDCTFGQYEIFRDNGIFVNPGDWVEAGQPIGIAGGDRHEGGPQVRFWVFYHMEQDPPANGSTPPASYYHAYVPLQFWIKDKGATHLVDHSAYTSEHPANLITKEMNKKDQKKWLETHKSS